MRKRANGEGSIRKRSNGTWEARVAVGVNPETGKLISKSVYGRTQKLVREKLNALQKGEQQAVNPPDTRVCNSCRSSFGFVESSGDSIKNPK